MMTRDEIEQVFSIAFAAAKENIYVKRWQVDFPELWSDKQLAGQVPVRVEFEHVTSLGPAEAVSWAGGFGGDTGRGRNNVDVAGSSGSIRWPPMTRLIRGVSPVSIKNLLLSASVWRRAGRSSA